MRKNRVLISVSMVALLFIAGTNKSSGDSFVYDNLQKSRDALLSQREGLERSRAEVLAQIDQLQQKVSRYDQYLRQVDGSIKDVDDALKSVR